MVGGVSCCARRLMLTGARSCSSRTRIYVCAENRVIIVSGSPFLIPDERIRNLSSRGTYRVRFRVIVCCCFREKIHRCRTAAAAQNSYSGVQKTQRATREQQDSLLRQSKPKLL